MINTLNKKLKLITFLISISLKIKFVTFYAKTLFIQDKSKKWYFKEKNLYIYNNIKSLFIYTVLKCLLWTDMGVGLINKKKRVCFFKLLYKIQSNIKI